MSTQTKLDTRVKVANSFVCVGLDSESSKLPAWAHKYEYPQLEFNKRIIDQTAKYVAAYKFNMAFYEEEGNFGVYQLEISLNYLQTKYPNIVTICDAKRGDIGNSSAAYARGIFDELEFDAVTLTPYLGRDAIQPFLDYGDKACIILCRTSAPGSSQIQCYGSNDNPLWVHVARTVAKQWNTNNNCMLVVAADYATAIPRVRTVAGDITILVPGIGAQGGNVEAVIRGGLNSRGKGLMLSSSRSIIFSDNPALSALNMRDTINAYRGLAQPGSARGLGP